MEGAGHLRRLTALALLLSCTGCSYATARFRDFGDMFRLEGSVGLGLQAHATVGELAHIGVGSSWRSSAGLQYGEWVGRSEITEDHFPLSYIYTIVEPDRASFHSLDESTPGVLARHRCYGIVPGEWNDGELYKNPIHYFDLEVAVLAGVVGLEVGFSLGEFVDWLLGWFTIDIADDDSDEARKTRTLWNKRARKEALVPK